MCLYLNQKDSLNKKRSLSNGPKTYYKKYRYFIKKNKIELFSPVKNTRVYIDENR